MAIPLSGPLSPRHPNLWFPDGDLVIKPPADDGSEPAPEIRVYENFLERHSRSMSLEEVDYDDLEAFLLHLYHVVPLSSTTPFQNLASIIRASSSDQLDSPSIHEKALEFFREIFPNKPILNFHHPDIQDAALVAIEHNIESAKKMIYYTLMREQEDQRRDEDYEPSPGSYYIEGLPPSLQGVLDHLRSRIISYFTPILKAYPRMSSNCQRPTGCDGVFRDWWSGRFDAVDGEYKPLETLERMIEVMKDWEDSGECECQTCPKAQKEDWADAMHLFWKKMDEWIEEGEGVFEVSSESMAID